MGVLCGSNAAAGTERDAARQAAKTAAQAAAQVRLGAITGSARSLGSLEMELAPERFFRTRIRIRALMVARELLHANVVVKPPRAV